MNIREQRVEEIKRGTMIDDIITREGKVLEDNQLVDLTDWVRAVLINNKSYLLAEKNLKRSGNDWKIVDKEYIRQVGS